jgi:hypothetical protein
MKSVFDPKRKSRIGGHQIVSRSQSPNAYGCLHGIFRMVFRRIFQSETSLKQWQEIIAWQVNPILRG